MNRLLALAMATIVAGPAFAEPVRYELDPSHSQIVFSYDHLGFSTTVGMFGGIAGTIDFDKDAPEQSAVEVSFPVANLLSGWAERDQHLKSKDFFDPAKGETVSFRSTKVEVTGERTGRITGDLTLNGATKEVVLEAELNGAGVHPMMNKDWLGFSGTTTLNRSDYGLGLFSPAIGEEVSIRISLEAGKAE